MTGLRIAYQNHGDVSVISTGAAPITSLPASNLKDDDIEKIFRSGGSGGDAIIIDLGAQKEIGLMGLLNANLISTDTVQFRVSNSDPSGAAGEVYNSGNYTPDIDPIYEKLIHFAEPAVTGQYIRISITKPGGDFEAGRLLVCPTWIPSRHFSFGWQPLWRDISRRTYSLGQNVFTDILNRQRGYRFSLKGLTTSEVQQHVAELNRLRGIGRDIFVCLDKDSTNLGRDSIWGLMEEPAVPTQIERDLWQADFEAWDRL